MITRPSGQKKWIDKLWMCGWSAWLQDQIKAKICCRTKHLSYHVNLFSGENKQHAIVPCQRKTSTTYKMGTFIYVSKWCKSFKRKGCTWQHRTYWVQNCFELCFKRIYLHLHMYIYLQEMVLLSWRLILQWCLLFQSKAKVGSGREGKIIITWGGVVFWIGRH